MHVAAQHAVAAVDATFLDDPLTIDLLRPGINADLHELGTATDVLRRCDERFSALRHRELGRWCELAGFQHVARFVIKRIEHLAPDALRPTGILEDLRRRANVYVEVN